MLQIYFVLECVVIRAIICFTLTTSPKADTIWNRHVKRRASLLYLLCYCYRIIINRLLFIQWKIQIYLNRFIFELVYITVTPNDHYLSQVNIFLFEVMIELASEIFSVFYIETCRTFVRRTKEVQIWLLNFVKAH